MQSAKCFAHEMAPVVFQDLLKKKDFQVLHGRPGCSCKISSKQEVPRFVKKHEPKLQ